MTSLHHRFRQGMKYGEIVDPFLATVPLPWDLWFLRVLILDRQKIATDAEISASCLKSIGAKAITRNGKLESLTETRERLEADQWRKRA